MAQEAINSDILSNISMLLISSCDYCHLEVVSDLLLFFNLLFENFVYAINAFLIKSTSSLSAPAPPIFSPPLFFLNFTHSILNTRGPHSVTSMCMGVDPSTGAWAAYQGPYPCRNWHISLPQQPLIVKRSSARDGNLWGPCPIYAEILISLILCWYCIYSPSCCEVCVQWLWHFQKMLLHSSPSPLGIELDDFYPLDTNKNHLGKGPSEVKIFPSCWPVGKCVWHFFGLIIVVAGSTPLWVVPRLGKWSRVE